MRTKRKLGKAALCLGAGVALSGCMPSGQDTVTVFAASSLTDVMEQLTETFSSTHPGTDFAVNYGSSTQLVHQIESGAGPDVLVTADRKSMEVLMDSGHLRRDPSIIATNDITLALAPANPANIDSLADVETSGVTVARCAPTVPCGRAAGRVLTSAEVELARPASADSARAVLTKVSSGQVDAGFVYATDALAARDQGVTSLSLDDRTPNQYPAALTSVGADNRKAADFHRWLAGTKAAGILRDAGFDVPDGGGR